MAAVDTGSSNWSLAAGHSGSSNGSRWRFSVVGAVSVVVPKNTTLYTPYNTVTCTYVYTSSFQNAFAGIPCMYIMYTHIYVHYIEICTIYASVCVFVCAYL